MALFTIAIIAAPFVYEAAKHYIPAVGKPEKKFKEKTGLAKFEKEHPKTYFAATVAADIAIFKGAGSIGKSGSKVGGKVAAKRAGKRGIKAGKYTVGAKKAGLFTRTSKRSGRKITKARFAGRETKIARQTQKKGTKYTITRSKLRGGSPYRRSETILKTKKVSRFTGKPIKSRSGRKYQSARDYASGWYRSWKGKARATKSLVSKDIKLARLYGRGLGKLTGRGAKTAVVQSWFIQDALIRMSLMNRDALVFDIPYIEKDDFNLSLPGIR